MGFGEYVLEDVRRRLNVKSYIGDWTDGLRFRVITASIFMFFASLAEALTYGNAFDERTHGEIDTCGVIFATAIGGMLTAVLNGQPLLIVGIEGPTLVFYAAIYQLAEDYHFPFLPFMAWVCTWAALALIILALCGASVLVETVTRFTEDIFEMLIGLIYLALAIEGMEESFHHHELPTALVGVLLTLATGWVALQLHHARTWRYFTPNVREYLAAYNAPICVLLFTAVSYWGNIEKSHVDRLPLPDKWEGKPPHEVSYTAPHCAITNGCFLLRPFFAFSFATYAHTHPSRLYSQLTLTRPPFLHSQLTHSHLLLSPFPSSPHLYLQGRTSDSWVINMMDPDLSVGMIFAAIAPGILLVLLLFFDHQVSGFPVQ
jgi:hypothetical protein